MKIKTRPDEVVQKVENLVNENSDLREQLEALAIELITTKERSGELPIVIAYRKSQTAKIELIEQDCMKDFMQRLENVPEDSLSIKKIWGDGDRAVILVRETSELQAA